jgi:uncharacterized membrane protein (DUF485 family)
MTYEEMQQKQFNLSLVLAIIFLISIFVIPFLNYYLTEDMFTPIWGIPFAWLYVGVFLHVEFWISAFIYTLFSNQWEAAMRDE